MKVGEDLHIATAQNELFKHFSETFGKVLICDTLSYKVKGCCVRLQLFFFLFITHPF